MQPINNVLSSWDTTAMTKTLVIVGGIVFSILTYFDISPGGHLLSSCLLSAAIINPLTKRISPVFEAYVDIGTICFFAYNSYYFYKDISLILLLGLTALSVIRIVMHSFVFRGKKLFWMLGLHLIPVSTAILFVLNIEPFYSIPIPTEQELLVIGTTTIIAFSLLFIQTIVAYVNTLNYIESSKEEVSYSYKQVLELNQILNHNLRTPLATALGQLEIAEIHLKENKHIAKAKENLSLVVNQTASVNNAKKAFYQTTSVIEFLTNWKALFNYEMVDFELVKNRDKYLLTEQVAIALAVSLDVFSQNSIDANADELLMRIESKRNSLRIDITDNGDGASEETIGLLGKPMTSRKEHGAGLGTYLAQRLIVSSGGKVYFSNRKREKGFRVIIEILPR